MNTILLFDSDFIIGTGRARLSGRRLQHIKTVHRAKAGDELIVGLIQGKLGRGRVVTLNETALEMEVTLDRDPPAPLPVILLLAMCRPKSLKKALHAAVCVGIKKIYIMETWRVEKSYWESPVLLQEKREETIHLALEQSVDTIPPVIEIRRRFKPFVEDEVPELAKGRCALAAHPSAGKQCPFNIGQPSVLAIGPEGGFIPFEIDLLQKQGFKPVSLFPRVLRVEEAIPALCGRLY
jgi:RsmE family RNA methyltransferase